ncbi:MAG: rod shape-determining protein MreD [Proteobacteria bacterium]|nr:rod shape-determining protein MreD [Pseudomonadota bacterium]
MIRYAITWWLFLGITFYLCGLMSVLPLAPDWQWYRPQWVMMLFIYCQISQPKRFNPIYAWIGGLLVDSLLETRLGEHALVFSIVCYSTALIRQKFLLRPLWLQLGKIFLLICLGQILILWFHVLAGQNPHTLLYWMGTVTSCLCWPFFVGILHFLGRMLRVAPSLSRSI